MQSLFNRSKEKLPQVGLALLLGFVLLVENVASILYSARQVQQSTLLFPLYAVSISTILTLWVHHDSQARNTSMGIDQAMYIFFAWPITFPFYALSSRGFRSGSLLVLSFIGVFVVSLIAAIIIAIGINIGLAVFTAG